MRHQAGTRVTATQVARHAGVSVATVSLVVNGKHRGRVSPANVDKVRRSIAELGYVVDRVASSLSKGSSDLVILIAPDISNPFFAGVIAGIKQVLGDRYQLLVSVTDDGNLPRAQEIRASLEFRPAALLVFAPAQSFVDEVRGAAPMVLIDAPGMEHIGPTINIDIQAYGVIGAARALGLRIPDDLSVASFDNLSYSAISSPSLTSVELPSGELGQAAAQVALSLIQGEAVPVTHEVFAGQLHVRESTAAYHGQGA